MNKRWMAIAALMVATGAGNAADGGQTIEAPPPPPPLQSGEALEPEVTIRRTEKETIFEYRQGGRLVLVRVQPVSGPPYYFVDTNGDGRLEYRPGDPVRNNINQWVIKRW
jgi:hypothetical protein